ncbi:MAG: type I restriction endonuclease subunit R [Candidatus Dormibacteria bacterium]
MTGINERLFEDAIADYLVASSGYQACKVGTSPAHSRDFDARLGLDTAELFAFIEATQPTAWSALVKAHGGDPITARGKFATRLAAKLDQDGTLDVLRHGVRDMQVDISLAYFKPAHGLTATLVERYNANRLTVTRQLPFDPASTKTVDLCLFVNGIPVATAELKNHLTGQTIEDAKKQYREDRDPNNTTLARRALVHFAADPDSVAMTTRLAGERTAFLPFNLGHNLGKGNPPNPHGHRSAYLWERVWQRDAWLDLIGRFIHVERPSKGSPAQRRAAERVIFPRYHQWDAVLRLEADAQVRGAGHHYLVEHSAGSGKSNTIAWTAHRLSTLHDERDEKIFHKVIVITDRVVLDRQLQDTVYQFEHVRGVVEKIDQNSQQLAAAIMGEQARIIITTLQKFPFVMERIAGIPKSRYAIIVDEAHSSQGGETAKELKLALGATEEQELTVAEAEDAGLVAALADPVDEALARAVAARHQQTNISFFAFTATPKARTLENFGTWSAEESRFVPFHLYSMRQAIEEGFILDVLQNYTTYKTFWKVGKTITEDPQYDEVKARRAIGRFVSLHPHHLAQKAEIIVEHFRQHTAQKIGGQAKAMVVTSSRLHAVRYKHAIDKYIFDKEYTGLRTLVAFSGKVTDRGADSCTEASLNGFPESQTGARFKGDDPYDPGNYQVMIVAEKYQTGFDVPLLHTMYVDKVLVGLAAVQTLSRLNRPRPLKDDTFILDFRNETDDIVKAFEPYYGRTVAPPTDPNLLTDTRERLDEFDVLRADEIASVLPALLKIGLTPQSHGEVYSRIAPARERFLALSEEDRLAFRDALTKFVRIYSFLSQVVAIGSTALERDYVYCRALANYLRDATVSERLDLGTEVELTHLRSEVTFEGSLGLESDVADVRSIFGDAMGKQQELQLVPLSEIVLELNERFGLYLTERDQLLFDQFEEEWTADPELTAQARNNTLENFRLVFDRIFLGTIVKRMDANDAIYKQILDDPDFKATIGDYYVRKVYGRLRSEIQDETGSH